MFKPTRPLYKARRRLQLTTKQVGPGYYKGNRTGSMGEHTKWGGYVIDWTKVRTYVPPERLDAFKVGSSKLSPRSSALIAIVVNSFRHPKDGTYEKGMGRTNDRSEIY